MCARKSLTFLNNKKKGARESTRSIDIIHELITFDS